LSRDSILGWSLILLVAISLFLSFNIWSKVPGHLPSAKTIQNTQEVTDLLTPIKPEKILVYRGDSFTTVLKPSSYFYDKTWDASKKLIALSLTAAPEEVDLAKQDYFIHKNGMEVVFPVPLPMSFIRQLFDISPGEVSGSEEKLIRSFLVIRDKELMCYLIDSSGNYYKIGQVPDTAEVDALIKEINDSDPPMYAKLTAGVNLKVDGEVYVSLLPYELPTYSFKREPIAEEDIASTFFADFSIIRRIEERDGTIIYTDGQQGLRIYSDGRIKYNFPAPTEQKKGSSLYEAFKTAIDFIVSHGGWPEGCYLASYEMPGKTQKDSSYTFNFRLRVGGLNVVNSGDYIKVTVEDNQVKYYYREVTWLIKQEGIKDLMTPVEALNTAVATKNIKTLSDIYPGYMAESNILKPVWIVKTGDLEVIIQDLSE